MEAMSQLKLFIKKDRFKFSAAHMTIFADGSKENLHGHNYQVGLTVHLEEEGADQIIDFAVFKALLENLCKGWDEKVLIQHQSPFVETSSNLDEVEVLACGKRYVFPADEVVLLPISNLTTEALARLLCRQVKIQLAELSKQPTAPEELKSIQAIEISIEESSNQGAAYAIEV